MNEAAKIYVAEILRAVHGPRWSEAKVDDPHRLNLYAERLADCERAQSILRHKGYGITGTSFAAMAGGVPNYSPGILRAIFRRGSGTGPESYGDIFDIWTSK
jgi:hypothetical protein